MLKPSPKYTLLPLSGAILLCACALFVLVLAGESLTSKTALSTLAGSAGGGLFLGGLASLYLFCNRRPEREGFQSAIATFLIPFLIGIIGVGALFENPPDEERRQIFLILGGSLGWWLAVLFGAVARARGSRWGSTLQSVLLIAPLAALLGFFLWDTLTTQPGADSLWRHWNGVRIVATVILAPVCCMGLFAAFALGERSCILLSGGFAVALLLGAVLGELALRPAGWPVAGAFAGGILGVAILIGAIATILRITDRK